MTWQVNALIRLRIVENFKEALETLEATIKLAKQFSNMRINNDVRTAVRAALSSLSNVGASRTTSDAPLIKSRS